jgi:hypothetical protein
MLLQKAINLQLLRPILSVSIIKEPNLSFSTAKWSIFLINAYQRLPSLYGAL